MSHDIDPAALVPTTWAEISPVLTDVIGRWHESEGRIDGWESTLKVLPASRPARWAAQVERLQLINTFQWHEEDKSRDIGADDAIQAAVKRSIDASNRRRVQAVDKLDDMIFAGLIAAGSVDATAPLNSESPGSIIDRLSVLALKIYHITEARDALQGENAAAMDRRLTGLAEQYDDLGGCLDSLLEGIRAGKVGLKLYRQVKVYKESGTGALKADLEES
ncbi:MAG: DUF4254 domain-containing protein [bacterium]|nr:DUF4254 domain-containing protein [bacterium]